MSRDITPTICIDDEHEVKAKVFRLFERERPGGACKHELWVRFDWTANGWEVSFYGRWSMRDAVEGHKPLTSLTVDQCRLAVHAMKMLQELWDTGKTTCDEISFEPAKK